MGPGTEHTDWRLLDTNLGYEVRPSPDSDGWEIRERDGRITKLTHEEFDQLRAEGSNPKGLS